MLRENDLIRGLILLMGKKKNLCMQTTAELKTINPFYIAEISKFRVNKCHATVGAAFLFQSLVKDS